MVWETVNGITGIVSALCSVASLGYFGIHKKKVLDDSSHPILNLQRFMSLLLASSGWALCCLSFLWVFEPFGHHPMDHEYQRFFGVILAFPAIVIFSFGLMVLGVVKR